MSHRSPNDIRSSIQSSISIGSSHVYPGGFSAACTIRQRDDAHHSSGTIISTHAVHAVKSGVLHCTDGLHDRRLVTTSLCYEVRVPRSFPNRTMRGTHLQCTGRSIHEVRRNCTRKDMVSLKMHRRYEGHPMDTTKQCGDTTKNFILATPPPHATMHTICFCSTSRKIRSALTTKVSVGFSMAVPMTLKFRR